MVAELRSTPALPNVGAIAQKLADLRVKLTTHNLDAYFIPSADEHLNEYLPEAKQRRNWLSGFTGSAGDCLVGLEQAWLFVDSRYYEQADLEVDSTYFQVCKQGLTGHQSLEEVLQTWATASPAGLRLGFDPFTLSLSQFQAWQAQLQPLGIILVSVPQNLVDQVRSQQPWATLEPLPSLGGSPVFPLPDQLSGESCTDKLRRLRQQLAAQNVEILPITKLDQIAWLFNLRGWDIPYNPVFIAYGIVTTTAAYLFTQGDRLTPEAVECLADQVQVLPYEQYTDTLRSLLADGARLLIDPQRSTTGTYDLAQAVAAPLTMAANPIEAMKACKNATEIAQMQQANLKASRAKTLTIQWVQQQHAAGQPLSEASVAAMIERLYAEAPNFQGLSFNTISGSGSNSSIVHYGIPNPDKLLIDGELLLLDSGAQYAGGTTDDTRTLIIGTPSPAQIQRYTEVLKAHINCAMQRFPQGTTGAQLDGITRSTLWQAGLDYGHGTGHGVGAFLNVHEGPNGISKRVSDGLTAGMINSIEPGFYQPGWGGIRLENLYVIRQEPPTDSPAIATPWHRFESLTYIPFEPQLIDWNLLNSAQRSWLIDYHQQVLAQLTPLLTAEQIAWLTTYCELPES